MTQEQIKAKVAEYEQRLNKMKKDAMADGFVSFLESGEIKFLEFQLEGIKKMLSQQQNGTNTSQQQTTSKAKLSYEDDAFGKYGQAFIDKVKTICKNLKLDPNWLMCIMKHESGLNHKAQNTIGATGLIQFMPATAQGLGVTTDALKSMSAIQQLDYVEKFYKGGAGLIKQPSDTYLYTFYPYAVGKPDSYIIGSEKSDDWAKKVCSQNAPFDMNRDGYISIADYKAYIRNSGIFKAALNMDENNQEDLENNNSATTKIIANSSLSASVGVNCPNNTADVLLVQKALNKAISAGLEEDGVCGPLTIAAIKKFQQQSFGWEDGSIDVGGQTAGKLFTEGGNPNVVEQVYEFGKNVVNNIVEQGSQIINNVVNLFSNSDDNNEVDEKAEDVEEQNGMVRLVHPNPGGTVTSGFGMRILQGQSQFHPALDIAKGKGSSIKAVAKGVAFWVNSGCSEGDTGCGSGCGNFVCLDHKNGYYTFYCHLNSVTIAQGTIIEAGQEIGKEGNTGFSFGSHLHFEIRTNQAWVKQSGALDPTAFIGGSKLFPKSNF